MSAPVIAAAVLVVPAAAADAPAGRIVFVRGADRPTVFSIRPDGSGLTALGRDGSKPAVSPDGQQVAHFGRGGIVIRRRDGSVLRRVKIRGSGFVDDLEWSTDGRRLSYLIGYCDEPVRCYTTPVSDLWVVRADGRRAARRVVRRGVDTLDGYSAYSWAPDGRQIVYEVAARGSAPLGIVDVVSGRRRRLSGTTPSSDPTWSSRGEIAFVRLEGGQLYTLRPGGTPRRLGGGSGISRPVWSPDGRRLAYHAFDVRRDRFGLWVIDPRRGRRWRIAAIDDRPAVWSPDSKHLVWESGLERLLLADAARPGSARFLTAGSDPDWG